jgi:tungstate transport system permease protein
MDSIWDGFIKAFALIWSLDRELLDILLMSLRVSGSALVIASVLGISAGALTALRRFTFRDTLISILHACMGLPSVLVGLLLYLILSRSGPLGFMALLYTPSAMIFAQVILAFPIIASLSHAAIVSVDPLIRQTAQTLGATPFQAAKAVIHEARYGIMSAVVAGFGRAISEVGAVLIVGGNIAGFTRVMTTTIALETDKGNFELALAIGIILLTASICLNLALYRIQRKTVVVGRR